MTVYLKNIGDFPYFLSGAIPIDPGERLHVTPEVCAINSTSDPEPFAHRVAAAANANLPAPRLEVQIESHAQIEQPAPEEPPTDPVPKSTREPKAPAANADDAP